MDKPAFSKKLKIAVPNPKNIHGIFQWCDRWCDRCSHTQRCMLYLAKPDSLNTNPEEFFNSLSVVFEATIDSFEEYAIATGDSQKYDVTDFQVHIRNLPSVLKANLYARQTKVWLETFAQKESFVRELLLQDSLLADCFEIIQWYQYFLEAKLVRALRSQKEEKDEGANAYDSLGKAKLVLVSIERCLDAWGYLLQKFSDDEDAILKILVELQQLQRQVKDLFPKAVNFVREGLDE